MVDMTLTVATTGLRAFTDEFVPVVARLVQQCDGIDPDAPTSRLALAFEDLLQLIFDSGLAISVYTSEGKSGVLDATASPVLQCAADLMAAVCDGLDALAARGQA